MALTKTQVSQLYVSLFGRASEGEGNSYWQTDSGSLDMTGIADVMLTTSAAVVYFGSTLDDNQAFIEHIYLNTLGKTYAEDKAGVDYWVSELAGGKSKGVVVVALINAAQEDASAGNAQDQFNNKVSVSDYTADNIFEYTGLPDFVGFIEEVTHDDATVTSAFAAVDQKADLVDTPVVYTITMVEGKDTITGGASDDQILGLDTTYNAGDSVDGGDGSDTLSLLLFSSETESVLVNNVETVVVRNAAAATNVDASIWSGVNLLEFSDSTAATTVSHLQELLAVGVDNNNNGVVVGYADDVLGAAASTQSLAVQDSTTSVSIETGGADKITSWDINVSGANIISLVENDLISITVSGDGDLQLLSADMASDKLRQISTILASSATGALTLDMSEVDLALSGGYFVSVYSGSGNDIVTASANDNQITTGSGDDRVIVQSGFDNKDVLDGGEGQDVLTLTAADFEAVAVDNTLISGISGFEFIGISDELDLTAPFDLSLFGVNAIVIGAGLNGSQELTGFSTGATVELQTDASEADVLTVSMSGATDVGSDTDTLNIVFNADLEADDDIYDASFDVKGINIISVTTKDVTIVGETITDGNLPDASDGYKLILINDSSVDTINITGTQAFNYSASATSTIKTVAANDMSGNMTLDFNTSFGGTQGLTISSGDGSDVVTGSAYGDIIMVGDGDDTVNITMGADSITGGSGADVYVVSAADISSATVYSKIADFSAVADPVHADKISNIASAISVDVAGVDVSTAETSGGVGMVITADTANGVITLSGADAGQIDTLAEWLSLTYIASENGKTVGFEFGGNTYIVEESSSGDGVDSLIELTGLASITALSTVAAVDSVIISA